MNKSAVFKLEFLSKHFGPGPSSVELMESVCVFRYASEVINKKLIKCSLNYYFLKIFTDCLTFVKYVYEVSNKLQMKRCFRSSVSRSLTVANI